ncbi:TPA: UDP-N-acetylmuramoyl-tripeptide--D-alanyl-D-alanine ligase, partial [bacterium]|nr:UDP-N-acetylmuramoyl-tripeptide--D-alanyl-D-alanine ligase [bacterium]
IERITSEKLSLAKSLNGDGLVVMNLDNEYLRGSVEKVKSKKITFAINNDADVMAKNIKITNTGSSFDLFIRGYKIKNIKFNLLGEHNILNLLGGIGVCLGLGIEIDAILLGVSGIKPIEHRLELKKIEGITVIDDSFNANEEGFKKAVDALSIMEKDRIIITPGIIEQGSNTIKVNSELGEYLVSKVDEVILVGENGRLLKDGLLKQNFDQNKIFLVDTFLQAWALVRGRENINVLIENDLPEIYLK